MKMGGKVCRTAPDNEKPSSPSFTMSPWHVRMASLDLQGDPGGYEHCVWRAFKEAPLPISTWLHEGGGTAPNLRTRRERG